MSYRIRPGDTLTEIAARFNTTVSALAKKNGIRNPNVIMAGRTLAIPGKSDSFSAGKKKAPAKKPAANTTGPSPKGAAGGRRALDIAKAQLGKNASSLKRSGNAVGKAMMDWVPNNVNCANFVSGVLKASGQITQKQVNASVVGLMGNLDRDKDFKRVSLKNARPGDVVSMKTRGGHHVVMFAGWKNGKPLFIGSNNVNRDGSQKVTYTQMNYPILAIHQYRG